MLRFCDSTGSCFKFQGSLISWFSKKQKTVALSSTESECIVLSYNIQKALWFKKMITKSIISQRLKHMDIKYFINRNISIFAFRKNVLTKPVSKWIHERCINDFGLLIC